MTNSYCSLVGALGLSRDFFKPQNIGKFSQCTMGAHGLIVPSVEGLLAREEFASPCLWASETDQKNFNVFLTLTRKENNLISKRKGSLESITEENLEVGFSSNCGVFA